MIHGPVFTLTDDRCSGKNYGQHGDVVDDSHHASKPCGRDIRVERDPNVKVYRRKRRALGMGQEVCYLGGNDLLCVAGAKARLHHCGCVDIDLDSGLASTQNIPLEVRRDVDHEGISAAIHQRNDVSLCDLMW